MSAQEWEALRKKARTMTLEQYATDASSIIRSTKEEIISIVEESQVDQEKLSELISIVNDASKTNNQRAEAIKKATGLIEVIVPLIKRLI